MQGPSRGFAYLVLLFWVAIAGVALSALGSAWILDSRREKETEFVFRAQEYQRAIESYAAAINMNGCSNLQELPAKLSDLLEDRRCGMVRHHLRRLYADPLTRGGDWGLVRVFGRIQGVYSKSTAVPLRKVQGIDAYDEWHFVANVFGGSSSPGADSLMGKCVGADRKLTHF